MFHEVSEAGTMGKIFWSSLLNKSASFIFDLGSHCSRLQLLEEKEWPFSRKDGPCLQWRLPHALGGAVYQGGTWGGVSISHGRQGCGGWAGMLFCWTREMSAMPAAATVRKGVPCLRLHGRVAATPAAVLWSTSLCWHRPELLRQAVPRRGSDALMVGLARWLWDGLGELSLEVHWDLRLSPRFSPFSLAFAWPEICTVVFPSFSSKRTSKDPQFIY